MGYCVVVDKKLAVSSCPLPSGVCFWKHRQSGVCAYEPGLESGHTVEELAVVVGLPVPDSKQISEIKENIRDSVKESM